MEQLTITINGKEEKVAAADNILALVTERGLRPECVVVERNYSVVPRGQWAGTALGEGDNVEIVAFVGGG
jgi:thiamine biosynthesis protein ThiS